MQFHGSDSLTTLQSSTTVERLSHTAVTNMSADLHRLLCHTWTLISSAHVLLLPYNLNPMCVGLTGPDMPYRCQHSLLCHQRMNNMLTGCESSTCAQLKEKLCCIMWCCRHTPPKPLYSTLIKLYKGCTRAAPRLSQGALRSPWHQQSMLCYGSTLVGSYQAWYRPRLRPPPVGGPAHDPPESKCG